MVYIGGLRFFLQLFFGIFGSFFSLKLVTGTLSKDLYIEKNVKGLKSDYAAAGSGNKNKIGQSNTVNQEGDQISVDTKEEEITDKFVRIKLTKMQMFFDPYF